MVLTLDSEVLKLEILLPEKNNTSVRKHPAKNIGRLKIH